MRIRHLARAIATSLLLFVSAGGIPGALIYSGSGTGRQGTRTLADSWFKGFGPRLGFAYQLNEKTVIRGGYGRSFGAVTTVTGSTHQRGFTQTFGVPDQGTNGILPNMILNQGYPNYPIPPFIDPSFANKDNIWSFDDFCTLTISVSDAPKPEEVVVAIAVSDGGRPFPRIGKGPITT